MASSCTAALTVRQSIGGKEEIEIKFSFICHTDGSFTAVSTDDYTHEGKTLTWWIIGKDCILGKSDPGSTAPTANYGITVTDATGADIFGGELTGRSATVTERAIPLVGSAYATAYVDSALSLDIEDNLVNGATGDVYLYFQAS